MERLGRADDVDVAAAVDSTVPQFPTMTPDEQAAWERAARTGDRFLARDVRLAYLRRVIAEQDERAA